ncbi:MAG: hypothetical protein M1281_07965 [Chloroflexi bacterium]|nr:hypothetical protein [Chloroflexota bacterium]
MTFDHTAYQFSSQKGNVTIYTGSSGRKIQVEHTDTKILVRVENDVYQVTGNPDHISVRFPDGRMLESLYTEDTGAGLASSGTNVTFEDWDRMDALRMLAFNTELKQPKPINLWQILGGSLLFIGGLLNLLQPRLAWQLSEGWRYENLEPSSLYLGFIRFSGAILLLLAIYLTTNQPGG